MEHAHPHFVLGYHGCDHRFAERIFACTDDLRESANPDDWFGHGTYFWENSPARAWLYAKHLQARPRQGRPRVRTPAIVGAIIDFGNCLNLLDESSIQLVQESYNALAREARANGVALPLRVRTIIDGPVCTLYEGHLDVWRGLGLEHIFV